MKAIVEELEEKLGKEIVVFVNKMRIAFPVEFDTTEGWCKCREYRLPPKSQTKEMSPKDIVAESKAKKDEGELYSIKYSDIIKRGKVQVAFWELPEDDSSTS